MATTKTIVSVDSNDIESTITRTNKKIQFKALRSDKVIERIAWVDEWAGCNFVKYNGSFWMLVTLSADNVAFFEYKEKVEEPAEAPATEQAESERPSFDHAKYSIEYRDADYVWQKSEFEGSFSDMVKYAKSLADFREWYWETIETMTEEIAGLTFEVMGLDTAYEGYNWGSYDIAEDKPIYHRCYVDNSEQYEVFIANDCGIYSDEGDWYCEISESGSCYAQAWGGTPAEAMLNAYAQTALADALEEGNCEDAVNACAYRAFEAMRLYACHWESLGEYEVMDSLFGIARRLVKRSCENGESGFDWEEF